MCLIFVSLLFNLTNLVENYIRSINGKEFPYFWNLAGTEVVMDLDFNIKNKGIFYTDSNGLEMQKR